ncbi:MAG: hypothetical protein EPO65_00635 [Dehalococcoidia bacterium]|nr:MAG: hypothetical protein EPO65_00635 [Dehalococcoidia bacterium]
MVVYCTREDVKSALDSAETARSNAQVDRAIETASRAIESLTLRRFYPTTATRYFDWPDRNSSRPWRLWLNADELISVTTLTVAGEAIASTDYFLEPANSGPPFTHVEIDLASSAAFSSGDTHQRAIAIAGVFGYQATSETVGSLSSNLDADTTDTASVSWTRNVGIGDILTIDNERVIVTDRTMVDTTQNLQADLAASVSGVTVAVTNGAAFLVGQILLVESERMLVVDIAGNNLTVKRAWDGSVLAAHTSGADIYALTGIDIDRAQLGTTLAAHTTGATISRHVVPGPIRTLCIAEAINTLLQEQAGWGRSVGSGESERAASGADLPGLRTEVRRQFGRRSRTAAV